MGFSSTKRLAELRHAEMPTFGALRWLIWNLKDLAKVFDDDQDLASSKAGSTCNNLWSDLSKQHLKIFSNCVQIMEYSYLLDMADQCEDPSMKLAYACKPSCLDRHFCGLNMHMWDRFSTRPPHEFVSCIYRYVESFYFLVAITANHAHFISCDLQPHGQSRCTSHINEPGSLSTQFLERPMRWLTRMALLSWRSR